MKISQFRNTEGKTLTTLAPADLEEESGGMEDILQVNILVMIVKLFIVILIIIVSADDQPVVCSCRAFVILIIIVDLGKGAKKNCIFMVFYHTAGGN